MTTLARSVTGVDTHLDVHVVAVLDDEKGRLLGVGVFETTRLGYKSLLGRLEDFGPVALVGVEGTSSYGAGLTSPCASNERSRDSIASVTSADKGCERSRGEDGAPRDRFAREWPRGG